MCNDRSCDDMGWECLACRKIDDPYYAENRWSKPRERKQQEKEDFEEFFAEIMKEAQKLGIEFRRKYKELYKKGEKTKWNYNKW